MNGMGFRDSVLAYQSRPTHFIAEFVNVDENSEKAMPRDCPSRQELTDFVLGEIPEVEGEQIAVHLETCLHCEQTARELDGLTDAAILALRPSSIAGRADPLCSSTNPESADPPFDQFVTGNFEALDDYEIIGELGRGGMGVVYRAWQKSLRRTIALKMLLGSRFTDFQTRLRFKSEAEAIAQLQHPHIVQIFQIGEADGQPFFTLEYVDGGSLDELTGKPLPLDDSTDWLETLARTLHYAHQHGIVHRDLKPDNVLLGSDGQLKITDFGVAKLLEGSDIQTASGLIIGTAEYMAPEQADAKRDVGPAADIYSLGAILYTLLTGRPPFQAESVLETLEHVKFHEPVSPRQLRPGLSRDLETICLKCLQKDPRNRYASAEALADDLRRFRTGLPILARPTGFGVRLWRWTKRNRTVAFLTGAVAILLILVAAGALWEMRAAQDRAEMETQAREELEQQLYLTYIALAGRECSANNMRRVDQLLAACRTDLRGWEWHYLSRRRHLRDERLASPRGTRIQGVAFSPDGRLLAVTSPGLSHGDSPQKNVLRTTPPTPEGRITIWNLETRQELQTLSGHGDLTVWSVAFSPDGKQLVSGGSDGNVWLWNLSTGTPKHVLRGHDRTVRSVAYSPDGIRVGSASEDGTVKIWNTANGEIERTLRGHASPARGVAFSPDGTALASTSNDKTVKLWRVETGEEIFELVGHQTPVRGLAFSPDGRRLATTGGTVKLWNTVNGQEIASLVGHSDEIITVAFSPDGERLASGGSDRTIRIWNADSGQETLTLRGHADTIFSVNFSPDGRRLASGGWGGRVIIWDANPIGSNPSQASQTIIGHAGDSIYRVACHPEGRQFATSGADRTVKIWERDTGRVLHTLPGIVQPVASLMFSPDGRYLVTLDGAGNADFWDVSRGTKRRSLKAHSNWGTSVAFSPNGEYLATACRSGEAKVWNVATGETILRVQGRSGWVSSVAIAKDNRQLATANDDGTVQIWDLATGKERMTLGRNALAVTAIAFSPDLRHLAASSRDETIKIWELETKESVIVLEGHTDRVHDMCYSADGQYIASASGDETVRIWEAKTGQELAVLRGHTGIVNSIQFNPVGECLISGSRDGTIRIWSKECWRPPPR